MGRRDARSRVRRRVGLKDEGVSKGVENVVHGVDDNDEGEKVGGEQREDGHGMELHVEKYYEN